MSKRSSDDSSSNDRNPRPRATENTAAPPRDPNAPVILPRRDQAQQYVQPAAERPSDDSSSNDRNPRPRAAENTAAAPRDPNAPVILPRRDQAQQYVQPAAAGNGNPNNAAALQYAPQNMAPRAPRPAVVEDDQVAQNPNLVILPRRNPNEITDPLTVAAIINNLQEAGRTEDAQRLTSGDAFLEQITNRETGARELRIVNRIEQAPANVVAVQGGNQVANNGNQQGGQGNGNTL